MLYRRRQGTYVHTSVWGSTDRRQSCCMLAALQAFAGLSVLAVLVPSCLSLRVPRVLCCVGAISATFFDAYVKWPEKKDYKDPIQDRRPINTCSPIATPRHVAGPQVWRSAAWRVSLRGLGCVHVSDVVRGVFVRRLPACVTSDVVFTARYAHPDMFC